MKAIAHGTAVTEPDGTFDVAFTAAADHAIPAKNEPVFAFTVHADITDTNGETRSDERIVRAGYTALQASVTADEWQTPAKPVTLTVDTRSLDGDPQPATGTVTIHSLNQPDTVARAPLQPERIWWTMGADEPPVDPSNPDSWEPGPVVAQRPFETDASGSTQVDVPLPAGIYRAQIETQDRFGKPVTARTTVRVLDPDAGHCSEKLANVFTAPTWSVEPGGTFTALWGTGYDQGRAFVEIECAGKVLQSFWTDRDRTQTIIRQDITEDMRGGLTLRVTYVRENRAYFNERIVDVPWSNKRLDVKWESFRSKLTPGAKETWTAVLTGPDAAPAAAEMVATLYDASLDQFLPHHWPEAFPVFRHEFNRANAEFENTLLAFDTIDGHWRESPRGVHWDYRHFPGDFVTNYWGYQAASVVTRQFLADGSFEEDKVMLSPFAVSAGRGSGYRASTTLAGSRMQSELKDLAAAAPAPAVVNATMVGESGEPGPKIDLSKVSARKNLNETAFFFPQLVADDDGVVRLRFTMPEALTQWRFLGFAHDRQLRSGFLSDTVVTSKDLMVEPNPPRFVREGDAIEFTVKVSNQSDQAQTGTVKLTLADAATLHPVDEALGNHATEQAFDVPAKQSRSFSWRITVPDGMGFLTYKAVGATAHASDGEEGMLPVLSRRMLVTESLPLPIRGKGTREFEFTETSRVREFHHAAQPVAHGADGVAAGLVRGARAALPDGIPVRMQRTVVQSDLRERARPADRELQSKDPAHL